MLWCHLKGSPLILRATLDGRTQDLHSPSTQFNCTCCAVYIRYISLTGSCHYDVQLSGMRGAVRRMPHHGRSVANPRTRRAAANVQYQPSPGSTLMVLSPGERDRDPMDPIAGLCFVSDRFLMVYIGIVITVL